MDVVTSIIKDTIQTFAPEVGTKGLTYMTVGQLKLLKTSHLVPLFWGHGRVSFHSYCSPSTPFTQYSLGLLVLEPVLAVLNAIVLQREILKAGS